MSYAKLGPFVNVPNPLNPPPGAVQLDAETFDHMEAGIAAAVQAGDLVHNVRDFGAKGNGTTADDAAFNAALSGGNRIVYVPAGDYLMRGWVRLYANTWLIMSPDAVILNDSLTSETVFVNGPHGNSTYATGYAGDGNLRITGGQIDMGPRKARSVTGQAFAIGHAEHVLIENVHMRNQRAGHFIELNSTRNAVVRNCTFTDQDPAGENNRECINVDYSGSVQFPALGAYDGTPSENILIESCVFTNAQKGVGSHTTSPTSLHRNVRVRDCVFVNMSANAVHTANWRGGAVTGCKVNGAGEEAVQLDTTEDIQVTGNEFINCGTTSDALYSVVYVNGGARNRVAHNRIATTHANRYAIPYDVQSGPNHVIETAGADPGTKSRIVEDTGTLTMIDGVYALTMADDTAVAIPFTGTNAQGLVLVNSHSAVSSSARGLYWARVEGTATLVAIAAAAAADVNLTTGPLTGTTGVDAKFTISAGTDGYLYFENRTGGSRRIGVQFVLG